MRPTHDDDERYNLDGIPRAELCDRLIRAQTEADNAQLDAMVLRDRLCRVTQTLIDASCAEPVPTTAEDAARAVVDELARLRDRPLYSEEDIAKHLIDAFYAGHAPGDDAWRRVARKAIELLDARGS